MKKLLLAFVLLLSARGFVTAQKIHFMDTSNRWRVFTSTETNHNSYETLLSIYSFQNKDTLINGHFYKRMVNSVQEKSDNIYQIKVYFPIVQDSSPFYFREDTAAQKVYCYFNCADSEVVVYNGNWQVGDSVVNHFKPSCAFNGPYYEAYQNYSAGSPTTYITLIDSTSINGIWYKVFHFNQFPVTNTSSGNLYDVIEGIGSTNVPYCPAAFVSMGLDFEEYLMCFENRRNVAPIVPSVSTVNYYYQVFDNSTTCTFLSVAPVTASSQKVFINPNPANSKAIIQFNQPIESGTVSVYNLSDVLVYAAPFKNQQRIPVGQYFSTPGFYFYQVRDLKTGVRYDGKFVFE